MYFALFSFLLFALLYADIIDPKSVLWRSNFCRLSHQLNNFTRGGRILHGHIDTLPFFAFLFIYLMKSIKYSIHATKLNSSKQTIVVSIFVSLYAMVYLVVLENSTVFNRIQWSAEFFSVENSFLFSFGHEFVFF